MKEPTVLVLDDYRAIRREEIHHQLTFLVEHPPPSPQVVLTTRREPALPLARMRAGGRAVRRGHAKSIFRKLDASGRSEAVARARQRGLI